MKKKVRVYKITDLVASRPRPRLTTEEEAHRLLKSLGVKDPERAAYSEVGSLKIGKKRLGDSKVLLTFY